MILRNTKIRHYSWLFLKILISAGLIYITIRQLEMENLWRIWSGLQLPWLLIACLIMTASYFFGAYQWKMILDISRFDLPYRQVLSYYYVGLFFNNFLLSGMGGDLLRIYDIHRHANDKDHLSPALATVFFDRFAGFITLIFLASLSGLLEIGRGTSIRLVLLILVMLGGWILLMTALFYKPVAEWTIKPIGKLLPENIYSRFQHLYYEINRFGSDKKAVVRILMMAVAVQVQRILAIWAVGRALGDDSPLVYYMIFVPLIAVAASLPISIGGTGPREQATIILFRRIGVAKEIAFSIGFIAYLVSAATTLPGAIIFILRKGKSHEN